MRTLLLTVFDTNILHIGQLGPYAGTIPAAERKTIKSTWGFNIDPYERDAIVDANPEIVRSFKLMNPDGLFGLGSSGTRTPDDDVGGDRLAALGYMEV